MSDEFCKTLSLVLNKRNKINCIKLSNDIY